MIQHEQKEAHEKPLEISGLQDQGPEILEGGDF